MSRAEIVERKCRMEDEGRKKEGEHGKIVSSVWIVQLSHENMSMR